MYADRCYFMLVVDGLMLAIVPSSSTTFLPPRGVLTSAIRHDEAELDATFRARGKDEETRARMG
jgi:hypothetical protein